MPIFTQNNKVAISLQYIKKEVSDEIGFLHVDKHESSLQIGNDIWWGWSNIPKVPKMSSLQCLYNISKNKLEMKLIFYMQINIKVSYKFISTLWASKFPTSWYYHYLWAWSSIIIIVIIIIINSLSQPGNFSAWSTTKYKDRKGREVSLQQLGKNSNCQVGTSHILCDLILSNVRLYY